jgi:protein-tyrosine phosphatase
MLDIHHHLLYGLDDGPKSLDESIAMATMAYEDGISHVVCTPHASYRYPFQPSENALRIAEIRAELTKAGIGLTLGLGCDFHLNWDNIQDAKAHPKKYSINETRYLLVEFPEGLIPNSFSEAFQELQLAGFIPIVTHPERNQAIQRDPARMRPWIADGSLVQVTAGSLLGRFGKTAQALASRFLKDDWVHIIATDAHNVSSRPPRMRETYMHIANAFGGETARRLCIANPRAVFEGGDLGAQPDPVGIYDDEEPMPNQSWLGRLLGR